MNEYKLTFTVTIQGQDDPAARKQAEKILEDVSKVVPDAEGKLQQLYQDQTSLEIRKG